MWNEPSHEKLSTIPKIYETEAIPLKDKVIHLHCFICRTDIYITEYDGEDLFWGFSILNGDMQMAEWGYISFSELKSISVRGLEVDCDLHWTPIPANEVELICKAQRWT
jgi:hypothetical protein